MTTAGTNSGAAGQCFHCGNPLDDSPRSARVGDGEHSFCGDSCLGVARKIADRGLERFYEFRDEARSSAAGAAGDPDVWATWDRPALADEFTERSQDGTRQAAIVIHGVRCAACSWLLEKAIGPLPGVHSFTVNPLTARSVIRWNPHETRLSALLSQIAALGFTPEPCDTSGESVAAECARRGALRRLLVAGLGMMQVMSYAVAMYAGVFQGMDEDILEFLRLVSLLVATPVVLYAGSPFFVGAWHDIRRGRPGMDVPVAVAIGAAWIASVWNTFRGSGEVYFDSATMFVFFLTGARYLELQGRNKALALTDTLARHMPRIARRLNATGSESVGVMELVRGDRVLVPSGETVPADGTTECEARINEALLSGESAPLHKYAGDRVIAGSINAGQPLTMTVTEIGADTVMAEIDRLVTGARADRPGFVRTSDRVAAWFVSAVLLLSAIVAAVWWQLDSGRAFSVTLATLVVSCPCALALATPAAFTVATARLARRGFLVRRAGALEVLARITHCFFDKTGTLTDTRPTVRRVETFADLSAEAALGIAASLEATSSHPLARAFAGHSTAQAATDVHVENGAGLEGIVNGRKFRIGSALFTGAGQYDSTVRSVFLADSEQLLARFEISEQIRDGARAVISALAADGIETSLISGDQQGPVGSLARELQIPTWFAELSPAKKHGILKEVQAAGGTAAMVGDGINDSPVLAGAAVSIAMGDGTPMAQQSADCVIVDATLQPLVEAFDVARQTLRVIRQNLVWALAYNVLAIPLAATGQLAPWMAALGMSASSLIVTFNALRLRGRSGSRKVMEVGDSPAETGLSQGVA